ncbi:LOW QUALITY PROTEIN: Immediate early response 3-interacting protein 1 [Gryllus bimaculatus]|nr:LOW QUALITY PROTEIN: Immediate early response 3-interacting protein 1 [Gryllus bimaculatus]
MAITLWNLYEASLLCLNAICVLHEERFLAKIGWSAHQNIQGFGEQPTIKNQILNLDGYQNSFDILKYINNISEANIRMTSTVFKGHFVFSEPKTNDELCNKKRIFGMPFGNCGAISKFKCAINSNISIQLCSCSFKQYVLLLEYPSYSELLSIGI